MTWDPVQVADLAGYRVYYGTSPGTYGAPIDVGNATTHTLTGLQECTRYYVAIKAYDTGLLESEAFSNELSGLPSPVVSSVTPARGEQGQTLDITVTGSNFDVGAVLEFGNTDIVVQSTTVVSCTEIQATVAVGAGAATGWSLLDAVNADGSYGRMNAAFEVVSATAPTVASTDPTDGAVDVPVEVRPTVTFSEQMDPATVTTATVRLIASDGSAVAQGSGSPSLDASGTVATVVPSTNLDPSATYRVQVLGGSGGVHDVLGTPMGADYNQNPGFTTGTVPDTDPPAVSAIDPPAGASDVSVSVSPTVTFDEAMDPASITASTVRLLAADGSVVSQVAGSPSLDPSGTVATIVAAANLDELAFYRVEVLGGGAGVKDLAGNPMSQDHRQDPTFQTENQPPGSVLDLRRVDLK
jgi:hypothetical protein